MTSWYDSWADRYDDRPAGVAADVTFYAGLAREADGPLVELAVGTGRVAIPVAQSTGRRVIGIDSSPAMLAQARARAAEEGVELDLREGDIRELELEEPAALIYCPARSLLHLPTWADRRRCFERVAASLRPGGRFAWNAFAHDPLQRQRQPGRHHAGRRRHRFALVGDQERMAGAPRRLGPEPRGPLRRLRRRAARGRQPRVRLRGAPLG